MTTPRRTAVASLVAVALLTLAAAQPPRAEADPCSHRFAAIAYSPCTGRYGYAFGQGCRAEADAEAVANCGAADARPVAWVENGWVALARSCNGPAISCGWSTRSLAEAKAIALRGCGGASYLVVWTGP